MKGLETGSVKKLLVRGTNWVGDSVISIPAMREIRRIFPAAHISLLVRPWVRELFSTASFVDEILDYDKAGKHKGWMGFRRLASDLKSHRFDCAILLQNAFEAAFLAWYAGIPHRIGYARDGRGLFLTHPCRIDPAVRSVHQAYYYVGILSAMGWMPDRIWGNPEYHLSVGIEVNRAELDNAKQMLRQAGVAEDELLVGLNPGAFYGPAKKWFPERYAEVADALVEEYNARIVIFGAANDVPAARQVASAMKHDPLILAGQTSLARFMGLVKLCRLLITNDSGPMHVAAALDVPQLAIFGSTSEIATGPLSSRARVIKRPVECSPCFLRDCPTDFRCMKEVSAQEVLEESRRILETATGHE